MKEEKNIHKNSSRPSFVSARVYSNFISLRFVFPIFFFFSVVSGFSLLASLRRFCLEEFIYISWYLFVQRATCLLSNNKMLRVCAMFVSIGSHVYTGRL